jgi:hypothetical protein
MNWKTKAHIQNCIARLPKPISYELYYLLQRHFGELKKPYNPLKQLDEFAHTLKKIQEYGYAITGKVFLEVGTGRMPLFPVILWLCGAKKIITMDLNPYMKDELIAESLLFLKADEEKIKNLFGSLLHFERLNLLLSYIQNTKKITQNDILKLCQIDYIAPGDATKINLPKNSVNYHVSHTVYEHIPLNVISDILKEGNRIVADDGLFINFIDYSDHFFYSDKTISAINFLQYDDKTWNKYAGNRYMYMNRARHDDFVELFKEVKHNFVEIEPHKNNEVIDILNDKCFVLDDKFKSKSKEILSITTALFLTKKQ